MGGVRFLPGDETLVTASMSAVELWPAPFLADINRIEHDVLAQAEIHPRETPARISP